MPNEIQQTAREILSRMRVTVKEVDVQGINDGPWLQLSDESIDTILIVVEHAKAERAEGSTLI